MNPIQTIVARLTWKENRKFAREVLTGRLRSREEPRKGRFMPPDVDRILDRAQRNIDDLQSSMVAQKNSGNFRMVFMSLTHLAIYRALLSEGTKKDYATDLVGDIAWKPVTESRRTSVGKFIIRRITADPHRQVGMQLRFLRRFATSPPGYESELSSDSTAHYWNFHRCPPLEFYRTQGEEALEMFRKTWCEFDFATAEWMAKGVKYERPHTLSAGDDVCDMKWTVARNE
ncbi:MAG: L-2-amino-thiazoline-4-carboxylic acid hydrolase [Longimicrobiales bacterium]